VHKNRIFIYGKIDAFILGKRGVNGHLNRKFRLWKSDSMGW